MFDVIINRKTGAAIIGSIYLLIALFGMSVFIMPSEHGGMSGGGCLLMRDLGSLCESGILDHIAHWNILFAAILAVFVVFAAIMMRATVPVLLSIASPPHERYNRYVKDHPECRTFQRLVLLFSDGIIHGTVYDA